MSATDRKEETASSQNGIKFHGIKNFRDLGGYECGDGKRIKSGMIYRSAELKGMTEENIVNFNGLNIKSICDLRSSWEIEDQRHEILTGRNYFHLPISNYQDIDQEIFMDINRVYDYSFETYKSFPLNENIRKIFHIIANENSYPILVHCLGGKDRTGVIIALLLSALGIPRDTIIKDYMLSSSFVDNFLADLLEGSKNRVDDNNADDNFSKVQWDNLKAFMYPNEMYLNAAFEEIENRFKNIENYFDYYGFTKEKREWLRDYLLEV